MRWQMDGAASQPGGSKLPRHDGWFPTGFAEGLRVMGAAAQPNGGEPSRHSKPLATMIGANDLLVVINIQLAECHFPAFAGVPGVVLHIDPSLEVQRLVAPCRADVGVPLITRGADAQLTARAQVNEVVKLLIQLHAASDGDDPTLAVIRVHAHF